MPSQTVPAPKRSVYVPWLAVPFILFILASAIFVAMWHLRLLTAEQIAQKDGNALWVASRVQIDPEFAKDPELRPVAIENKMLEVAQLLTNIIALRLFDAEGLPQMVFPPTVRSVELPRADFAKARALQFASVLNEAADLSAVFETVSQQKTAPLLRVVVPIESDGALLGVAEFLMDGRNVQSALTGLNRNLWRNGLVLFVISGGITAVALGMAFGRLQTANAMLAHRTASLLKANHELTLAAKTSAVGAITAHLIHDLKSPLFGLQTFVAAKGADSAGDRGDWDLALSTTERMQKMINDVVRILQEEKTTIDYELSIDEMLQLLRGKIEMPAREAGLTLQIEGGSERVLANRDANIVLLVLTNLAQNAIQATPRAGTIRISAGEEGNDWVFDVEDTGPGLPQQVLGTLFTPSRSSKKGGTGLGLAISKQLANHAGAELVLKETSEKGTTFRLRLPERATARAAAAEGR